MSSSSPHPVTAAITTTTATSSPSSSSSSGSSPEWPSIAQFYARRDVFVTGGTGFLGKCLIEKLIRSIPEIGRVMVLVRPKRGKTVKERIETLLSSKVSQSCSQSWDWKFLIISVSHEIEILNLLLCKGHFINHNYTSCQ